MQEAKRNAALQACSCSSESLPCSLKEAQNPRQQTLQASWDAADLGCSGRLPLPLSSLREPPLERSRSVLLRRCRRLVRPRPDSPGEPLPKLQCHMEVLSYI